MKQALINRRHFIVLYLTLAISIIFTLVTLGWEAFYTTIWYEQSALFYVAYYLLVAPGWIYFIHGQSKELRKCIIQLFSK